MFFHHGIAGFGGSKQGSEFFRFALSHRPTNLTCFDTRKLQRQRLARSRSPRPNHETQTAMDRFKTTRWTLIDRARSGDAAAWDELAQWYGKPVYKSLRQWPRGGGFSHEDAQDLTQDLFAALPGVVLRADRKRGKFRQLVRRNLRQRVADFLEKRNAKKRGGGVEPVSLGAQNGGVTGEDLHAVWEQLFDRQWANRVIELAMKRLRQSCESDGKGALFAACEPFLFEPGGDAARYEEAAAKHGVEVRTIRNNVAKNGPLRKKLVRCAQQIVCNTEACDETVAEELRILGEVIG